MDSTSGQAGEAGLDPRAIWRLLRERRWLFLGAICATALLVCIYTLRQPKVYEAACLIEYDPTPPRPLGSQVEDVAAPTINFWMTKEWYQTQNRIIQSRTVVERVVRDLSLNESADFFYVPDEERGAWESKSVADTALELIRRMRVEQAPDTRLVSIKVRDRDPERAQLLANGVAHAYIEHTREERLGATAAALRYLAERLDSLTSELQGAEEALHRFREEHDVLSVSLEDQQNVITRNLQQYSEALADATTRRIALAAKLRSLREANVQDPMAVDATMVLQDAQAGALRTEIRELRGELAEKAERYGENHPEIRALRRHEAVLIAQLRQQVDGLIGGVAHELSELRHTEAGYRAQLDAERAKGLALNRQESQYNELKRRRQNTEKLYDIVLERTTETDLTKEQKLSTVRLVDEALVPARPVSPRLAVNLGVGLVVGLLLGLGLAVVASRMDRTLKSAGDVEALGLTVLGLLPSISGAEGQPRGGKRRRRRRAPAGIPKRDLVVHEDPTSSAAESARAIRTNLTFMAARGQLGALVLTSPSPLEGKTTVATSIAIALAQGGKKVVLVDTDMRRPRLHRAFDLSPELGISTVLVGEATLDEAVVATQVPNLSLLPCGPIPPNPSELLHTPAFAVTLGRLRERFDHVIFDSPPLGAVTDSAIIAPQVDAAILVMKAMKTTRDAVVSAMKQLRHVEARVLGAVLNDVDLARQQSYYGGYYHYSGYYYGKREGEDEHADEAAE